MCAFCLGAIMLLSGALYALIAAGIGHDTHAVVKRLLAVALAGSLLLALERAIRS
jgi:hypothetical protein